MAPKPKLNVSTAMAAATLHAVRLLQDPETRAQLIKVGNDASRQVRAWYQARSGGGSADDWADGGDVIDEDGRTVGATGVVPTGRAVRLRRPASLFAHERLERRTVKLAASLDALRGSLQENGSDALDGVDEAILRIHLALKVAGNLPFAKRAKAHHEIGVTLGVLEKAVLDAVLTDGAAR